MKINPLALTVSLLLHDFSSGFFVPSTTSLATRQIPSTLKSFSALRVGQSVDDTTKTGAEDSISEAFEGKKSKILGQPIPYSELTIGVLKETFKGENRVSQVSALIEFVAAERNLLAKRLIGSYFDNIDSLFC